MAKVEDMISTVGRLIDRLQEREATTDAVRERAVSLVTEMKCMRQYQEELLTFNEFAEKIQGRPNAGPILGLATENKQMEQLNLENTILESSNDEYKMALEVIMDKYRDHVSKLMLTNEVSKGLNPSTEASPRSLVEPSGGATDVAALAANLGQDDAKMSSRRLDASDLLAALAEDVCDRAAVYTDDLEAELHSLRKENAGLRDMLSISSAYESLDPGSVVNSNSAAPFPTAPVAVWTRAHAHVIPPPPPEFSSAGRRSVGMANGTRGAPSGMSYRSAFHVREVVEDEDAEGEGDEECGGFQDNAGDDGDDALSDCTIVGDGNEDVGRSELLR